jgi:hypothetical protein
MRRGALCAAGVFFIWPVFCAAQPAAAPHAQATEDCVRFDPLLVSTSNTAGDWKVMKGPTPILDYGADAAGAQRAVDVIRHYHFTRQCFVRGPGAVMMYWKNGVAVPPGNMPGQDCIVFNPANVTAQFSDTRWKVSDGSNWLLDYGQDHAAADHAAAVIKSYSLNRECFVERPRVAMQYWLAQ